MKKRFVKYGTMLYLVYGGNVLMIEKGKRKDDPNSGYFTLPGGKLEDDEKGLNNPQGRMNSSLRETFEETGGIKSVNPVLRGIILFNNIERTFANWKNPDDFLVYIFAATDYNGKAKPSDEGIPHPIPLNKINDLPSNPGDKKMYEWLKDGRNFFGVVKHKGYEIDEYGTWADFF